MELTIAPGTDQAAAREQMLKFITAVVDEYAWAVTVGGALKVTWNPAPQNIRKHGQRLTEFKAQFTLNNYLLLPGAPTEWAINDYRFDFKHNAYEWNGKKIYISPINALSLYERLILKRPGQYWWSTLMVLQKRFGKTFLEGLY